MNNVVMEDENLSSSIFINIFKRVGAFFSKKNDILRAWQNKLLPKKSCAAELLLCSPKTA
ncbi:MAG: hypothetical protein A3H64_01890 [Candidatus Ryanbacteria bacterium RIFCSPLOWO2_02_FULL_45_11c]|uniref:Uncharacterized protein n=1 Tax=Candidatus Ryanbacteria bacterium RIFCSPLOWO2_02_FULL_45_11c TaxID=1802128 RepID=A0A1G2GZN4_9BACT|nr:MAG: hypothetical protein A3H64_01890 [Candidatus Ryanbacteria bacterium RIFCSPLOWO2_02_FULL_45_11c]